MKKKIFLIGGIVLVILLIIIFIYFFSNNNHIKKEIDDKEKITLLNIDDLIYEEKSTYFTTIKLQKADKYYQSDGYITFLEDNCYLNIKWNEENTEYELKSTNCNYNILNDNIDVNFDGILVYINENNIIFDKEILDYKISGSFKYSNKSHLLLDGITFVNEQYQKYIDNNITEILIDSNNVIYKTDGTRPWGVGKIDLNKYVVKDKRKNNNNTSNYENIYDITNLIDFKSGYNELREINFDELINLFNKTGTYVIVFGSSSCRYCQALVDDLKEIQVQYEFQSLYLNFWQITSKEKTFLKEKLINSYGSEDIGDNFFATPRVIILENEKVKNYLLGYSNREDLLNFLNENGIIY